VKGFRSAEPTPSVSIPAPPPPPVLPPVANGRTRLNKLPPAGRSKVPQLDPREQLMIAIREHGGRKKMQNTRN